MQQSLPALVIVCNETNFFHTSRMGDEIDALLPEEDEYIGTATLSDDDDALPSESLDDPAVRKHLGEDDDDDIDPFLGFGAVDDEE